MIDEAGGIQWPYPEGTGPVAAERRLFEDGRFPHPDGRARFRFDNPAPLPKPLSDRYPFILLIGRGPPPSGTPGPVPTSRPPSGPWPPPTPTWRCRPTTPLRSASSPMTGWWWSRAGARCRPGCSSRPPCNPARSSSPCTWPPPTCSPPPRKDARAEATRCPQGPGQADFEVVARVLRAGPLVLPDDAAIIFPVDDEVDFGPVGGCTRRPWRRGTIACPAGSPLSNGRCGAGLPPRTPARSESHHPSRALGAPRHRCLQAAGNREEPPHGRPHPVRDG